MSRPSSRWPKVPTHEQYWRKCNSAGYAMGNASRRRPTEFFALPVVGTLALGVLGICLAVVLLIGDQQLRSALLDVITPVVGLLVSVGLFIVAQRMAVRSRRLALAWGMIALATLLYCVGDTIWAILEVVLQQSPFPSIADAFYLVFYPVFLAGVFLLPDKPSAPNERIHRALDMGIVMVAAILGFWNLLIGPTAISNAGQPILDQVILTAYPVGDLVLFGALLVIIYNRSGEQYETPLFLLSGGVLMLIITDAIFSHQVLIGTYASGGLLDLGWIVSTLLVGMAGISQWAAIQSEDSTGSIPYRTVFRGHSEAIREYLPYFWLIGAYVLLIAGGLTPLPMSFLALSLGVGVIIALVLVRQIVTLVENKRLNTQLQTTMGRLQTQAAELDKTNLALGIDIAERKRVEQALRYSEERYRLLFDKMVEGFALHEIICDAQGQPCDYRFLDVNPAFEGLTGLKREQLIGRTVLEVMPQTESNWIQVYGQVALSGKALHFEDFAGALDKWYDVVAFSPQREQFATIFLDITERKRVETQRDAQFEELRRWQAVTMGRETRVVNLKREINTLLTQAGQPIRYASAEQASYD